MTLRAIAAPAVEGPSVSSPSVQSLFRDNRQLVQNDPDWEGNRAYLLGLQIGQQDVSRKTIGFVVGDAYVCFVAELGRELDRKVICEKIMELLDSAGTELPDGDDVTVQCFESISFREARICGLITADRLISPERRDAFSELLIEAFNRRDVAKTGTVNPKAVKARTALAVSIALALKDSRALGYVIHELPRPKVASLNAYRRSNGSIRYRRRPG